METAETYPFALPPLPYAYEALEPFIDTETMHLHHDKHHQTYITNLNNALKEHVDLQGLSAEELLRKLNDLPEAIRTVVRNNAGGHVNHTFFWTILGKHDGVGPSAGLAAAIDKSFGSKDEFEKAFAAAALKVFGSGWVFLIADAADKTKLSIVSRPNQDSTLQDATPTLLGLDVWEHAYYLKYQNRRVEYIAGFWSVVDWSAVSKRFDAA